MTSQHPHNFGSFSHNTSAGQLVKEYNGGGGGLNGNAKELDFRLIACPFRRSETDTENPSSFKGA